jgi:PAS domain S-box-containing protein
LAAVQVKCSLKNPNKDILMGCIPTILDADATPLQNASSRWPWPGEPEQNLPAPTQDPLNTVAGKKSPQLSTTQALQPKNAEVRPKKGFLALLPTLHYDTRPVTILFFHAESTAGNPPSPALRIGRLPCRAACVLKKALFNQPLTQRKFSMSSSAKPLPDTSYAGRILGHTCSPELEKRLLALLTASPMLVSMDLPVFHYVAAWKDDKTDIWYEFADPRFCKLFSARPDTLAKAFRTAVLEQKVYPEKDQDDGARVQKLEAEDLAQDRRVLRNRNIAEGASEAIYKVRLPEGSCIWLKDQARLETFPQDGITLSTGVLTPVSNEMVMEEALRRAEKALSHSEKQFRDLFAQSNDAILLLDARGRILKANRKAEELTGLDQEDLTGRQACDLFPEAEHRRIQDARVQIASGREARIETFLNKDEGTLEVDINARQVITTDNALIQAVIRDISIKKRLEAERSKREKFDMLKTLAGGLVHDVNNLLSAITGNLSLAAFENNLPPGIVTILNRIETATSQLKNITRKMLVLADADTGVRVPGQIRACLQQALDMVGPLPPAIRLLMDIPVILPSLPMDRKALTEAFAAILENSLDAMPKGGILTIQAHGVSARDSDPSENLCLLTPGDYLCIHFMDTGSGIEEKNLSRIFDPYFSTKQRGTRKGTGLGLSLAYAVIKQHGGHILAQPTDETRPGASILIYLPLA